MSDKIKDRIKTLRSMMGKSDLSAYIIPSSDPHQSEYVADHWKLREWISGFDGSAGTVVILRNKAGLWTDSRYFLQADMQLHESGIALFKDGISETPSYTDWICSELPVGSMVGIDGEMFSVNQVESMRDSLASAGITLETNATLINDKWAEMPPLPSTKVFRFDKNFSGKSTKDKLDNISREMEEKGADMLLLTALDEIAWTFNLRSSDIEYNPVVIAYALIGKDSACLFINKERLSAKDIATMEDCRVKIDEYHNIYNVLSGLQPQQRILIDKDKTNYALYDCIRHKETIIYEPSMASSMKAIKNEIEINGVRNAMVKDGIALCNAFFWLETMVKGNKQVSEIQFADKLREYRAAQPDFFCESFGTIAGFGPHGAIVHYKATPDNDVAITKENLLLVDSGANYLDGTTDITRTMTFGKPSNQQKRDFTNVLKGHIALANIHFPRGTHGVQLDVLARQFLWNEGLSYGHGTGHGIGHFLCVHEGPQNIRTRDNGIELLEGMLISNEPGLYRTGEYGIRSENMILVQKSFHSEEFGDFLQFETLTLFPFDKSLIETQLMTENEIEWINDYHQRVYDKIGQSLAPECREWLREKTSPLEIP